MEDDSVQSSKPSMTNIKIGIIGVPEENKEEEYTKRDKHKKEKSKSRSSKLDFKNNPKSVSPYISRNNQSAFKSVRGYFLDFNEFMHYYRHMIRRAMLHIGVLLQMGFTQNIKRIKILMWVVCLFSTKLRNLHTIGYVCNIRSAHAAI